MEKIIIVLITALSLHIDAVEIIVDANSGRKPVSPWIYGQNNADIFVQNKNTVSAEKCQLLKEAGVRMFRLNGGNNLTKYNWRKKLGSHPDWYNNVYATDWDHKVKTFLENTIETQIFMGFQLLGWAASSSDYNFNDWAYNQSQWWCGASQNLAGGGEADSTCSGKEKKGNPNLYLMDWPADSTTAILDHWFADGGLGFDKNRCLYWNMDNEPECWVSTHDDVTPKDISAEDYMQRYFKVAKLARQKFPEIKLMGPVPCNEWFWYTWNSQVISEGQKTYTWLEYFIKRISDEQKATGLRLLDVIDVHFYPSKDDADLSMQLHRIWFDTSWVYRDAGGSRYLYPNQVDSVKKEYIFERCRRWCNQYLGPDNGVTFSCSEYGQVSDDPSVRAVSYASQLGTFANEGVEVFTPWDWMPGQWEVLHLFSRYAGATRVESISNLDSLVSAYSSISKYEDTLTMIFVNRDRNNTRNANVTIKNFVPDGTTFLALQLNDLPENETFKTHESNALSKGSITLDNGKFSIDLPTVSVTAVIIAKKGKSPVIYMPQRNSPVKLQLIINGNTLCLQGMGAGRIALYDTKGRCIRFWNSMGRIEESFSLDGVGPGRYIATFNGRVLSKPVLLLK
ncbi:MAG TPA: glycoside hydrolase family 44 protein [Chitinispirillaceae bacterium]|nr:glycoside hydrolase family 44 protein [Chitinispirillaceae bacterium]